MSVNLAIKSAYQELERIYSSSAVTQQQIARATTLLDDLNIDIGRAEPASLRRFIETHKLWTVLATEQTLDPVERLRASVAEKVAMILAREPSAGPDLSARTVIAQVPSSARLMPARQHQTLSAASAPERRIDAAMQRVCAGFANAGGNCAFNSVLQAALRVPLLLRALTTVAEHYADKASREGALPLDRTPAQFPSDEDLANLPAFFTSMQTDAQIWLILDDLMQSPACTDELMKGFWALLSPELQAELKHYIATANPMSTIPENILEEDPKGELVRKGLHLCIHEKRLNGCGKALKDALEAHAASTVAGEIVPAAVSQQVRRVLYQLFLNPSTGGSRIAEANRHEDAWEVASMFMERYEEILRARGTFPDPAFFQMHATLHYRAEGVATTPDPAKLARGDYSRMGPDCSLTVTPVYDHQLLLDLQSHRQFTFTQLLRSCFQVDAVAGSDSAAFLTQDERLQPFRLVREEKRLGNFPGQLTLVVKRFAMDDYGNRRKLTDPVGVQRWIALPSEATSENRLMAYALTAFVVHMGGADGGHYVAYKQVSGRWIECDDASVNEIDASEIDRILHGQKQTSFGVATSYLHFYERVDDAKQAEALKGAFDLEERFKMAARA